MYSLSLTGRGYKPYCAPGITKRRGDWRKPRELDRKDEKDSFESVSLIKDLYA